MSRLIPSLRLVHCLYDKASSSAAHVDHTLDGPFQPGIEYSWRVALASLSCAPTLPRPCDVFFFEGDTPLLHHRMTFTASVSVPQDLLYDAIEKGLTIGVMDALHRGALTPATGGVALHLAVQKRYFPIIDVLLAHGASFEAMDAARAGFLLTTSHSVLYRAMKAGDMDMLRFLLARGVRALSEDGGNALLLAIARGTPDIIQCFLQHMRADDDLNARFAWKAGMVSPLSAAYDCNEPEIALQLLEAGASAVASGRSHSVLLYCITGVVDADTVLAHVVLLLERGAGVDIHKTIDGETSAMTVAIERRLYEVVLVLVAHQAEATSRPSNSYDAHVYALARDCDDGGHMLSVLGLPSISYAPMAGKSEPVQRIDLSALDQSILDALLHAPPVQAMETLAITDDASDDWLLL
ncbi:hypothetical protein SPRG_10782 [Saprolegnia parasitica CBS 223.65]|uniref:Uncharacterized protein n=1 Tax=Saprolegnia parasitica (strain CBS 223.65) TaxID=695850 RepID=A0A067C9U9_SAPPC|nr:hypothetical protein SPRG_10782 [Saprolegnia parasitica CBS 223.65]KDO23587.1 hypothetical protein SPRG_10782 [Saprolegnia parasitica CBS 223.65]|eukprot:XP_012205735.1 hypothetical protein SPRG_10782 [Saprolegnia parasitica CBS 223.65]